ncbi:MAG TPA: hypothetical protein VJK54_10705 [Chthoniobacterales bacterium]|nr:hypothetical protein [Chthoniobacterales bacterium]
MKILPLLLLGVLISSTGSNILLAQSENSLQPIASIRPVGRIVTASGADASSPSIAPTLCMFSRTAMRAVVVGGSIVLPSLFERSFIKVPSKLAYADERKPVVNPSTEYASTNYQNSFDSTCSSGSPLPSSTAATVSPTSHLSPPTTMGPIGRIVTDELTDAAQRNIQEAVIKANKTRSEAERINNSWLASRNSQQVVNEAAWEADAELAKLESAEKERTENIRWEQLNSEERKKEIIQQLQNKTTSTVGTVASYLQEALDFYQKSAEYLKKTHQTQDVQEKTVSTQTDSATVYRLITEKLEQAAKNSIQAAESYAKASGEDQKWREGNRWRDASKSLQLSVECRIKGVEAQRTGSKEKAQEYTEAAEIFQQSSEKFTQAVQLLLEGKEQESNICWSEAHSFQSEGMVKKYRFQELEEQETGKAILAVVYREAASTSERAADQYKQSIQAYTAGKIREGICYSWAGRVLQAKANYQAKAIEAQEVGKETLVAGYKEVISILQIAAEQFNQTTETYRLEKWNEGNNYFWKACSLYSHADYQAKAFEAENVGKNQLAVGYKEAAIISKQAVAQRELADEAYAERTLEEGVHLAQIGKSFQARADYQAKVSEAEDVDKIQLATGYREAIATLERAIDQYQKAATIYHAGRWSGGHWDSVGKSLQAKAAYQAKECEAQEAGKTILAAGYRQAAVISEQAAEQFQLSAKAIAAWKIREARIWYDAGTSLQNQADYQAKASEAQIAKKMALVAIYQEVATLSEEASDHFRQSAQDCAEEKIRDSERFCHRGKSAQEEANKMAKKASKGSPN